jgi:hypothetical protein
METRLPPAPSHCAYCGHAVADNVAAPQRFGDRFCSDEHADEFAKGARAARIDAAARRVEAGDGSATACAGAPGGQQSWQGRLKRAACWGAPLLLLLAMPLLWTGGWAAAGGSLLSVLALLACPIGMYFMMRSMTGMQQVPGSPAQDAGVKATKDEPRA